LKSRGHRAVADAYPDFSICGLPDYLSGDATDWRDLAHRTTTDLELAPTTRSRLRIATQVMSRRTEVATAIAAKTTV
jgi:hypothetical protein